MVKMHASCFCSTIIYLSMSWSGYLHGSSRKLHVKFWLGELGLPQLPGEIVFTLSHILG